MSKIPFQRTFTLVERIDGRMTCLEVPGFFVEKGAAYARHTLRAMLVQRLHELAKGQAYPYRVPPVVKPEGAIQFHYALPIEYAKMARGEI